MNWMKPLCILFLSTSLWADTIYEETASNAPMPIQQEAPVTDMGDLAHDSLSRAITKMVLAMLGLILLFGISYWMLKRLGRTRYKSHNHYKAIKVLEKRPISPKTTLYLLELAGKEGTGPICAPTSDKASSKFVNLSFVGFFLYNS